MVLDAAPLVEAPWAAVEAFWYVSSLACATSGGCEAYARAAHRAFLAQYGRSGAEVPLIEVHQNWPYDGEALFVQVGDQD